MSGEAPPAWPVEGVLNPNNCVLNRRQNRAKRGVSGEAPPAWPVEGVLNPYGRGPFDRAAVRTYSYREAQNPRGGRA